MRISDWSSDVCSSDLLRGAETACSRCLDAHGLSGVENVVGDLGRHLLLIGAAIIREDTPRCARLAAEQSRGAPPRTIAAHGAVHAIDQRADLAPDAHAAAVLACAPRVLPPRNRTGPGR